MLVVGPGSTLDGRYRLEARLGSGGFGEVYAATHLATGRALAIKLLTVRLGSGERHRRLLREARLAATVESEHITQVLDAGLFDGIPFIVMERLRGEDLGRRIHRRGALSPEETALFLLHVASALTAAHHQNVIHLDLKPRNMFLTRRPDGSSLVKLLDFGTAKLIERSAQADESSLVAGTPIYMAPEQFLSGELGPRTDLFAFGMCAFHMLVGQAYFALEQQQTPNPFTLGALLMHGAREPASSRAARYEAVLPEGFDAWFARCTHPEPTERFASASEAHDELLRVLEVRRDELDEIEVAVDARTEHDDDPVTTTATLNGQQLPRSEPDSLVSSAIVPRPNRLGAALSFAAGLAVAGVSLWLATEPPALNGAVESFVEGATTGIQASFAADPSTASPSAHCRFSYRWDSTEARAFQPDLEGDCDRAPFSPLVLLIHDVGRGHDEYRYLQRHLAHNGFISLSISVGSESPEAAAVRAQRFLSSFVLSYWPRAKFVDRESVALVGHGRGAEAVRHLARLLGEDPVFEVLTLVLLAATGRTPTLDARHAQSVLAIDPRTSAEPPRGDEVAWTQKVLEGSDPAGFVDGGGEQNGLVQGYALAFLAAHHQGDHTWHDRYVAGNGVPGAWTSPVLTRRSDRQEGGTSLPNEDTSTAQP